MLLPSRVYGERAVLGGDVRQLLELRGLVACARRARCPLDRFFRLNVTRQGGTSGSAVVLGLTFAFA